MSRPLKSQTCDVTIWRCVQRCAVDSFNAISKTDVLFGPANQQTRRQYLESTAAYRRSILSICGFPAASTALFESRLDALLTSETE